MARQKNDYVEPRVWALRDRTIVAPQTLWARKMRREPTDAEKKLWHHLHRLSVPGSHFRRQVRLGPYTVDFVSHGTRVAIEVDGGQHAENLADAERTKFIEGQGYRVLRFWNHDVMNNIDGVLETIQNALPVVRSSLNPQIHTTANVGAAPTHTAERRRKRHSGATLPAAPSPLVGEGRGRVATDGGTEVPDFWPPTPDPSPQGGGETLRPNFEQAHPHEPAELFNSEQSDSTKPPSVALGGHIQTGPPR
jgi:very-short-patch-repair endonuclease